VTVFRPVLRDIVSQSIRRGYITFISATYYHIVILAQLEGHSVERMYRRQRSSDASVNKTILQARLAVAVRIRGIFPM